jgi:type VI secretion system (T6SS) phospholipase Tle1-like effector
MKRIILLLDGTWNDADRGPSDTNIVRLREIIAKCLESRPSLNQGQLITPASTADQLSISAGTYWSSSGDQPSEHLVYYERGVGTGGFLDLFFGGAFGIGLSQNIRRAYRFLSQNYESGDQVFVFGFSRGSYTARSLVGYTNAAGLLYRNFCTVENESLAWSHYRANPSDRVWRVAKSLSSWCHRDFQVSCVGVFDTVGALGVPVPTFWRENRDLFEFHDVGLTNGHTQHLHALAIDEHRLNFEPTLWRRPKFGAASPNAEQVWFAGAHSDVGGGNVDEEHGRHTAGLDDLTLDWMIKRVLCRFANFPVKYNGINAWGNVSNSAALAPQDEPRRRLYRALPFGWRSINNITVRTGIRERAVARDRHAETIGESIHISALERLGHAVRIGDAHRFYAPKNLVSVLDDILARYGETGALNVVDYEGDVLPLDRVKRCVADARHRLLEAEALRMSSNK